MSSVTTSKLFKSRNILINQLKQRGFQTDEYSHFNSNELHAMIQNEQLDMLLSKDDEKLYVRYLIKKQVKTKNLDELVSELFESEDAVLNPETDQLLIITKMNVNDTLRNWVELKYNSEKIFVSIINIDSLMFNVLEHKLVPTHRVLSKEEKDRFCKQYFIKTDKQVPEISRFDPVAMAIGLRPGEICEIERTSSTSIHSTYYRICV
jgi:DNA-directed RNA polymerase subunit H (RpoH/RPB5)